MDISLHIQPTSGLVRIRTRASSAFDDWTSVVDELRSNPDYRPDFGFLLDLSGAGAPRASCLRRTVTLLRAHRDLFVGSRWAVVARDPATYGMVRMAQGLAGDDLPEMVIVGTVQEAREWLARGGRERFG